MKQIINGWVIYDKLNKLVIGGNIFGVSVKPLYISREKALEIKKKIPVLCSKNIVVRRAKMII